MMGAKEAGFSISHAQIDPSGRSGQRPVVSFAVEAADDAGEIYCRPEPKRKAQVRAHGVHGARPKLKPEFARVL